MSEKRLFVCAYGDEHQAEKGIVELLWDASKKSLKKGRVLSLEGKCNLAVESDGYLYLSHKRKEGCFIEVFDVETFEQVKSTPCEYFYSYGQIVEGVFLLASYESGVDSVFDLKEEKFISHCVHQKERVKAKSHYIQKLKDGQLIGIENGLQQLIVYEGFDLKIKKMVEFPPINIRLLSVHPNGKTAYLNTEYSNELLVLNTEDWSVCDRWMMADDEGWYSGGNAINHDGSYVCATVRGQDRVHVFSPFGYRILPVSSFGCGQIPRDLMFVGNDLFVSCTESHRIEVYDFSTFEFKKCAELEIKQPVTFGMGQS